MTQFKGFGSSGLFGLSRRPTELFSGFPTNIANSGVLPYAQLPNLIGWFNNGDNVTLATGVSSWVDRISGANLAQATGANQPSYSQQVQAINGKNKIICGTSQYLSAGDVFDIGTAVGWSHSFYGKILTTNTNRTILGKVPIASAAPTLAGEYKIVGSSGPAVAVQFFDNVSLKTSGTVTADTNNYYLYTMVIDITGGFAYLYINEKVAASMAISTTLTNYNNGSPFVLNSSTTLTTCECLEIMVWQTALTQSEIAQNTIACKLKYGQL